MGYKVAASDTTGSVTLILPPLSDLRQACTSLAESAAREIMRIYAGDLGERTKADKSPVTDADQAAELIIAAGLRALTPGIPVVAEEEMAAGEVPKLDTRQSGGGPFWLVDPLDGTKEFIKRNGEFTVNIALIEKGRPTLGIVLAPATETLWRGAAGLGADKRERGGAFTAITTRTPPPQGLTACASRSHAIYSDLDIWFRNNNLTVADRIQAGSSLKFCLIAEGKADIYPRFGPTNEWDTAAGQGVLEAAGGEVVTTDDRPLLYGKPRFSNPHFIARSLAAR
jgi:3'(2'), 5'-bisphosphate nucleotidase